MWFRNKKISTPITKSFYALGTINTISIIETVSESILDLAIDKVYDIDNKMSVFKEDNDNSSSFPTSSRHKDDD